MNRLATRAGLKLTTPGVALRTLMRGLLGDVLPPVDRFPIAILSFNRPHYLAEVLVSLRAQVDERDTIILFQDGAWNAYSGKQKAAPELVAYCVGLFKKIIPWGIVAQSRRNIGVAENYWRAEQEVFGRAKAPYALFLEDDLVLSPNYLAVIRMLLELARKEPRIGYVSAYGHLWASAAEQAARPRDLIRMHHFWGFATTRTTWLADMPVRRRYLRLVQGRDYSDRPAQPIHDFYRSHGWKGKATSQDEARAVASAVRGTVRITTFPCHARYIGRVGIHCTPKHYENARYGSSVIFEGTPSAPLPPDSAQIEAWLADELSGVPAS